MKWSSENSNTNKELKKKGGQDAFRRGWDYHTKKSVSPTYKPKSVSVIDAAQGSDVQQMELSSTFCNNHYGKRIQESTDVLYVYIITEKSSRTLMTSTKPQINCIPMWQRHEITEKERKWKNYLFHCLLPPWHGLQSHPWSLRRLGSYGWTEVGLWHQEVRP